jgi:molybdenum transport protein
MFYFTDAELDEIVKENLRVYDATTAFLRIENKAAKFQISALGQTVVCCTEEVMRILNKLGIQTTLFTPSGELIERGVKFFEAEGLAGSINAVAGSVTKLIAFASGVASRTRTLTELAYQLNAGITVTAANNFAPLTCKITSKAVHYGGGALYGNFQPDQISVNDYHMSFTGGIDSLKDRIAARKRFLNGKVLTAEVSGFREAMIAASAGVDIVQLDNFPVREIIHVKKEMLKTGSSSKLAISNFITPDNISEYASSGADILITTWINKGYPSELKMNIVPAFDIY